MFLARCAASPPEGEPNVKYVISRSDEMKLSAVSVASVEQEAVVRAPCNRTPKPGETPLQLPVNRQVPANLRGKTLTAAASRDVPFPEALEHKAP
ncbi:hypothetical protein ZHAS_00020427 [Anopheles sinensis]|uniref:Uncharacterized protein n=1 Tax=Anopheles sinensis TaxID=74873 RepID=A0A084WPG6_ANOSI|nr:hypothetical protein ZHAS_00020427 [Anopheles sinensis]